MLDDDVSFRILGPIEVERDGSAVPLGSTKQRALLAYLLLNANQVVGRDRLLDALWGERPPESAGTALHGYVSGLRKALGTDRIETRSPGYLLRVDDGELDAARFTQLATQARSAAPAGSALLLREALGLFCGEPLADLDGVAFVDHERRRLEEIRLAALEARFDADLALGRHTELVAELEPLVREHPLRERLRGQLMLALYRSGRQAEALEVYRDGRAVLAAELGLEPGQALRRLERSILEQDAALGEPAQPPTIVNQADGSRRRPRRHAIAIAIAVSAAVILAGSVAVVLSRGGEAAVEVVPNSVAVLDGDDGRLTDDIPVGRRPVAIAFGAGGVWVANADDETITRIDPRSRTVTGTFGLGTDVSDVAVGLGSVWVADGNDGTVTRIDPRSNTIQETLQPGESETALSPEPVFWVATGAGAAWAIKGTRLLRIDPDSGAITSSLAIPAPTGLAADAGGAWVVTQDQRVLRVSRDGTRVTGQIELPALAGSPVSSGGSLWLLVNVGRGEIWRVDPVTLTQEATGRIGAFPISLGAAGDDVWVAGFNGAVSRLEAVSVDVVSTSDLGFEGAANVAVGGNRVWVTVAPQP